MARILLGRGQSVTIDGVVAEGTREVDVDIGSKTIDVTHWTHPVDSTLVLSSAVAIRVLVYWEENYAKFAAKFNRHPPLPFTLGVTGAGSARVVPTIVTIKQPIAGVVAWEVTCRTYYL